MGRSDQRKRAQESAHRMREKHLVHSATPFGHHTTESIEQELDKEGSKMRDIMQEKRGRNAEAAHKKFVDKHDETVKTMEKVHRRKQAEKRQNGGKKRGS